LLKCHQTGANPRMMRVVFLTAVVCVFSGSAFAEEAAQGKQVYADSKCAICHSIGGVGNKKGSLDDVGARLTAAEIREWITAAPDMAAKAKADRKPPMKANTTLAKEDLDALVAYLQTLKTPPSK
jgi:mono/diheme cytochrome c family protein